MPKGNAEIIRLGYEMLASDDVEGVAALFAPDAELQGDLGRTAPGDEKLKGPDRFRSALAYTRGLIDDYRIKTGQFLEVGDDSVAVGVRISYVRRDTGKKRKTRDGHMWRLRDGLIVHGSAYESIDHAVIAAGGGYDPGPPPEGKFGKQEMFGRFETQGDLEGAEVELPAGQVMVSICNFGDTHKLKVDLNGPDGPVEMAPTTKRGYDRDATDSKWTAYDIAAGEVTAPGVHSLRVTGFQRERRWTIVVGRGLTGAEMTNPLNLLRRL